MRTHLVLIATCLLAVGCATPKSREEMLASVKTFERSCSPKVSTAEASRRLQSAWTSCFVASRGIDIVSTGHAVERARVIVTSEEIDGAKVLIARLASPRFGSLPTPLSNSILLMADIRETSECRSEVVVRATKSHWEKRSDKQLLG